jgi:hypothetical protein
MRSWQYDFPGLHQTTLCWEIAGVQAYSVLP